MLLSFVVRPPKKKQYVHHPHPHHTQVMVFALLMVFAIVLLDIQEITARFVCAFHYLAGCSYLLGFGMCTRERLKLFFFILIAAVCDIYNTCGECSSNRDCGWCCEQQRCVPNTEANTCGSSWLGHQCGKRIVMTLFRRNFNVCYFCAIV